MKSNIKKIFINSLLIGFFIVGFYACNKDQGNYVYNDINELSFESFDTVNGYSIFAGDSLKIYPKLIMTKDQDASVSDYSYEWSLHIVESLRTYDSVISTEKNLVAKIMFSPGNYFLQYKVTDKTTGVPFHIRTNLMVSTPVYEGYLILNDVDGQSRLDMLSYDNVNHVFAQYTNVLGKMESSLPSQGEPYQVLCINYPTHMGLYGIYLLTASGTNRLEEETFDWEPVNNIRYMMVGAIPEGFKVRRITAEMLYSRYPLLYLYSDESLYTHDPFNLPMFTYIPLNNYGNISQPFRVSPYVATNGNNAVMYDMDNRNFVTAAYRSKSVTEVSAALNYPTGYDLVYMERNYSNNVYAILQDPSTSKYYLLRFVIGKAQTYFEEITGTDFANATHYAISPDLGYLFYSVGGKLYEYDLSLKTSILMLDKVGEEITYLSFQNFYNRTGNTNYGNWAKLLTVGSYDGSNGTLELYSVPSVNGQIVRTNQWTGFGKIVSVAYRERY